MPAWVRGSLVLTATLAAGIAIGAFMERSQQLSLNDRAMDPTTIMRTLDRELGLDSLQHVRIAGVFAKHQHVIDSAWRAMRPGVQAAIDSSQMEIVSVLSPTQQQRYMTLIGATHPGMGNSARAIPKP